MVIQVYSNGISSNLHLPPCFTHLVAPMYAALKGGIPKDPNFPVESVIHFWWNSLTLLVLVMLSFVAAQPGRKPWNTVVPAVWLVAVLAWALVMNIVIPYTVWPEYRAEVGDYQVESLVKRLRGKLEPDPRNPVLILTVRGRGYKLVSG